MSTMTETDRYNGYANRETWAFNLHWQNDQGLYNETLAQAGEFLAAAQADEHDDGDRGPVTDFTLGETVVDHWREFLADYRENFGSELPEGLAMFRDEVGSWWRIDYAEVGAAVRESLEVEGDSPAN